MTFVSYAQNFEDVMLWRALQDIPRGFYIDVGAWSPEVDSVTLAFYERGWSGINIEPNPAFHSLLQQNRPRDQNLCIAVGAAEDRMTITLFDDSGLSTFDPTIAARHQQAGRPYKQQEVRVTTLATLLDQCLHNGQEIHFMKLDIEGLEYAALCGNNWEKYRPWILVVESTLPLSHTESHGEWEPLLLASGYVFAYADGLNRFYVSREHAALLPALRYPPNIFDDFILIRTYRAESRLAQAETRAYQAEAKLQNFVNSMTWRLAAPIRGSIRMLRLIQRLFQ
jgi:FkbM family methyltransferase